MAGSVRKLLFLLPLVIVCSCTSQVKPVDRQPAVAGQFYPQGADDLNKMLDELFARAVPPGHSPGVVAIIVPHAGYVFSGGVAASGYNQIDAGREYDNIFIMGPSHYIAFDGASVYTAGDFITPLGKVTVNRELGESLIKDNAVFSSRMDAHSREHSVEVQVPFLQKIMKKPFRIVPIVIGAGDPEVLRKIAGALRPYLNDRNLFVVSSDFSHYPAYDDAVKVDKVTSDAILTNSPDNLILAMQRNESAGIPNLATSLCGWPAVLTLLYMTAGTDAVFTKIDYKNSGDAGVTDRKQVVGYCAITIAQKKGKSGSFNIDDRDRGVLLSIARSAIANRVLGTPLPESDPSAYSDVLKAPCGAFVTLNENGALRGCIGRFDPGEPLYKVVQEMAVASATEDTRFQPVGPDEVKNIEIEISVLSPLRRISTIDEFQLGKQGIYMRKGFRSGTFLPQVEQETGWTKEEFLGHCAQEKAGIGWDGWKDADLYVYEAVVFGEK